MSKNVAKDDRPKSSKSDIANLVVGIAQYKKLGNIEKGTNQLIIHAEEHIEIAKRHEGILLSVDDEVKKLVDLQSESNEIQKQNLDLHEKKFKLDVHIDKKNDERLRVSALKENEKELKEQKLQSFKDITYQVFRQHQKIDEKSMTNLERLYTLETLSNIMQAVDANILNEKVDKEFCDQTKDALNEKIEAVKSTFTTQDKSDLKTITEIEREDENEHACKLLDKINAKLAMKDEVFGLMAEIKNKKKISGADFKEMQSKISQIRKKAISK